MDRVKELVAEQYKEMGLANKNISWDLKQIHLVNRCQEIIYNDWGVSSLGLWDRVDKAVKELIPDEYEDEDEDEGED